MLRRLWSFECENNMSLKMFSLISQHCTNLNRFKTYSSPEVYIRLSLLIERNRFLEELTILSSGMRTMDPTEQSQMFTAITTNCSSLNRLVLGIVGNLTAEILESLFKNCEQLNLVHFFDKEGRKFKLDLTKPNERKMEFTLNGLFVGEYLLSLFSIENLRNLNEIVVRGNRPFGDSKQLDENVFNRIAKNNSTLSNILISHCDFELTRLQVLNWMVKDCTNVNVVVSK
jgi:hypothetical protein